MGPSVKLVLPIIDAFPDKKNGGNFLCGKKGQTGGGAQCLRNDGYKHNFVSDPISEYNRLQLG